MLPFVNADAVRSAREAYFRLGDMAQAEKVYETAHFGAWLGRCAERPQANRLTPRQISSV